LQKRGISTQAVNKRCCDNVFLWIEDIERAQRFADRLASVNWPSVLNRYARKINPLMVLAALAPKPRVNLTRLARIIPDTLPLRGPAKAVQIHSG
jgi:hypothetical protein